MRFISKTVSHVRLFRGKQLCKDIVFPRAPLRYPQVQMYRVYTLAMRFAELTLPTSSSSSLLRSYSNGFYRVAPRPKPHGFLVPSSSGNFCVHVCEKKRMILWHISLWYITPRPILKRLVTLAARLSWLPLGDARPPVRLLSQPRR